MAKAKRRKRAGSRRPQPAARRAEPAADVGAEARAEGSLPAALPAWAIAAALAALTAAVYFPVAGHEFIQLDDPTYFTKNPHLDGLLSLEDVHRALAEPYFANWIPLTHLSIALGDAIHGARPGAVTLTNAALHALGGILLFLALARMTGRPGPSSFVAAVFLVHPLHVESVAWASSRKDVLVGVWWMATLFAYARYCERPSGARYAAVALGLGLALLSKATAVTLPFVLLLLDVWPLRRLGPDAAAPVPPRRLLLEKLPLFAMVAAASVATWLVQRGAGAEQTLNVPLPYRLANAVHAYAAYLLESFWPVGLAAYHPYPDDPVGGARLPVELGLLVAVSVACVALARRLPALVVGWLWFLGTLVPTIGIVQVGLQARADRYMYLPLVGLALAVAFATPALLAPLRRARVLGAGLAGGVVLALALAGHAQVRLWRDTLTLFEHTAAVTRDNHFALQLVGNAWKARGELDRAERALREAVRVEPGSADARTDLAALLAERGRTREASAELERAREAGADGAGFHAVAGLAAERAGQMAAAIAAYERALEREPLHPEAANNLAWLLATVPQPGLRDPERAIELARRALTGDPDDAYVLDTLAAAQAAAGRSADAVATQSRALDALPPDVAPAIRSGFRDRLERYRARDRDAN